MDDDWRHVLLPVSVYRKLLTHNLYAMQHTIRDGISINRCSYQRTLSMVTQIKEPLQHFAPDINDRIFVT